MLYLRIQIFIRNELRANIRFRFISALPLQSFAYIITNFIVHDIIKLFMMNLWLAISIIILLINLTNYIFSLILTVHHKVGVRRLAKADDCEDNDTQTNQSLQYWREMNCSEQFGMKPCGSSL